MEKQGSFWTVFDGPKLMCFANVPTNCFNLSSEFEKPIESSIQARDCAKNLHCDKMYCVRAWGHSLSQSFLSTSLGQVRTPMMAVKNRITSSIEGTCDLKSCFEIIFAVTRMSFRKQRIYQLLWYIGAAWPRQTEKLGNGVLWLKRALILARTLSWSLIAQVLKASAIIRGLYFLRILFPSESE